MAAQDMADDSLDTLSRRKPPVVALAALAVAATLFLLLAGIALFGRASDGEPVASVDITQSPPHGLRFADHHGPRRIGGVHANIPGASIAPLPIAPPSQAPSAGAASQGAGALASTVESGPPLPAAKIETPIYAGRQLVADPALIERTPQGPLPRIADDGRSPLTAYAPPAVPGQKPRIALLISGLGISAKETTAALAKLPPQVTLAFAPYADDVQRWVSEARAKGHEVILEVPMESYDFPDSDPGPHTLRAAVSEQSNTERLIWSLTRVTGYAGITNLLGGRFLSDPDSVAPVMAFLARRGLLFFDSGPDSRSVASDVARQISAPYVQSSVAIDNIQTAMEIDARLSELEARARADGVVAGTGFVYPVTIERVTNWAAGLGGRGFVLVAPSAIVLHSK